MLCLDEMGRDVWDRVGRASVGWQAMNSPHRMGGGRNLRRCVTTRWWERAGPVPQMIVVVVGGGGGGGGGGVFLFYSLF